MKITPSTPQDIFPAQEAQESLFPTLTNHQGWEITLRGDCFSLKNSLGIKYDDIDSCIIETDQMSDEGVKKRFINSSLHEVHVETHKGQTYVRFGAYGLPGGAPGDEDPSDWTGTCARGAAYTTSAGLVVYGVYKLGTGENLTEKIKGASALGAGISGASSLYKGNRDGSSTTPMQYLGKSALGGALGAGAATAAFYAPEVLGGGLKDQVWSQSVIGAASGAISTIGNELIEKQSLPTMREVGKGAALGGVAGGTGTFVAGLANELIPASTAEGLVPSLVRVAKEGAVGASGAGFGAFVVNAADCFIEGKKFGSENLTRSVLEAALMGGAVSASISGVSEYYRYQDHLAIQEARAKMNEAKAKLEQKKAELDKTTEDCEALQQEIELLEQELAELNAKLSPEVAKVDEERTRKQERLEEARKDLEVKKGERVEAEKRYQEARKAINKATEECRKAKRRAERRSRNMEAATESKNENQQKADRHKEIIRQEIKALLGGGYKAKIGGRTHTEISDILEQVLKGKYPTWTNGKGPKVDWSKNKSIGKHAKKYRRYTREVEKANRIIKSLQTPEEMEKEKRLIEEKNKAEKKYNEALHDWYEERCGKSKAQRAEESAEADLHVAEEEAQTPPATESAPDVPDFRYLSLNSLLGSSNTEDEE